MNFKEAQQAFSRYEMDKDINYLRDSLDILEEIIAERKEESQKAINFKSIVGKRVEQEINSIYRQRNVAEFSKDVNLDADLEDVYRQFAKVLCAALSESDFKLLKELEDIKERYFSNEA